MLVLDGLIYISKKKYGILYSITLDFIDAIVLLHVTVLEPGEEEYRRK